jgi:hypothetical protein
LPDTLNDLRRLEEGLLQPLVRKNPQEVSALLADDFLEFGSSGRVFDKAAIIAELATEVSRPGTRMADFEMEMLSPVIALVRYRTILRDAAGVKQALRSSIWIHRDGRWQMKFHQGTPAPSIPSI